MRCWYSARLCLSFPSREHPVPEGRAPLLVTLADDLLEILVDREVALSARDGVDGQLVLAQRELEVAHLGDLDGARDGVGDVREDLRHLLGRADVQLRPAEAHPVRVVDGLARADAEHHVVRLVVLAEEVVRVVGGDERDARLLRQLDEVFVDLDLVFELVILNFEEVIPLAEDVLKLVRRLRGLFESALLEVRLRDARQTRREADEAAAELDEQLAVDARLAVEAFLERLRGEADEVVIPLAVFGEEDHVVVGLLAFARLGLVRAVAGREVDLAADERLDVVRLHLLVEGDRAVHVAVVGHRARLHPQLADALGERLDLDGAVEE